MLITFDAPHSSAHCVYRSRSFSFLVVVIGDDHRFGRNREGDFSALKEMGKMFGFEVIALDAKYVDDLRVSSTKIML